jgi:hypothetical protein
VEIRLQTIYKGSFKHVVVLEIDGKCPARDYLDEAEQKNKADHARLVTRIQVVADTENFRNSEIFNVEGDGLYAFKTSKGLRLYAFYDENRLLIACYGADKAKKKQQQKDIGHAKKRMNDYFEAKKKRANIQIVE